MFATSEAAELAASFVKNVPSMIRKYAGDFGPALADLSRVPHVSEPGR